MWGKRGATQLGLAVAFAVHGVPLAGAACIMLGTASRPR
jgi:hypothetical protein